MICDKNRLKRRKIVDSLVFPVIVFVLIVSSTCFAAGGVKEYQRQFSIGGQIYATITVVGMNKDARDVEKLFDIVISKANDAYLLLNPDNPGSDVSKVIANAGRGPVSVSVDALAAFETAEKISDWTKGAFDIAYLGEGNWRDIKINKGSSSIELKRSGMKIRFDPMLNGFFAELLSRYLNIANAKNALVQVGSVYKGTGEGIVGPWKVSVDNDVGASTFAHRAISITVANTGIATVTSGSVDPRSKKTADVLCKGVTVAFEDASIAQGLSFAAYILGPNEGMKLITKYAKGLIIDNSGKVLKSPGL